MPKRLHLILLLAAASLLGACGSSDSGDGSGASTSAKAESGAFPVTIEHKYGKTEITKAPKRVVVAGLREQDAVLALGIVPVATTEWFGDHPGAIFPWAEDELGSAKTPTVLDTSDGLQIEKIAGQNPDLILAIYSGMTKKEYAALSKIAPVVAQPRNEVDYGSSWQEETLLTGQAVGQPEKAQELVDETEKLVADAAAEHPEFKGKTAANVTDYEGVFVYGPQDVRTRTLEDLGFTYPEELSNAFPDEFGGDLSDEKIDALDVDALVWFADGDRSVEELKDNELYKTLDVRKQGRDVFIREDDRVYEATSFPSVLSMPTLMKELVPRLAAAVDGDPSTSTDEQPATAATDEASFPAKVEHAFGTTTVESKPKRVVTVGFTEQDVVLQLGFTPVGVSDWYGDQPSATWPWARDMLGDAKPVVLNTNDGFQFEKIASLRPDLIIGANAGMEKADYEKLSKLAPTIASPKGGTQWFSEWDDQVRLIAAALGKPKTGDALVKQVEDNYAAAAEKYPEFKGKTVTFAQNGFYSGLLYAYQDGLSTDFLTMLGFKINPKLTPLVKNRGEQVAVSAERLDVIDADAIVFATEKASDIPKLEKVPTFEKLGAVKDNRAVFTDGTLAGAMYFMTPLSLDYVLDHLTPQLADAVAGKAPRRMVQTTG